MHEFSICEGIVAQVKAAQSENSAKIKVVKVLIGEMSGVEIMPLKFWFPVVATKMAVPQLQLEVITVRAQARCNSCNYQFWLKAYFQECPKCNSYANFQLIQGKELIVYSIIM
jgi:hydrogenase nickel incorporation protein HypA/HybF